MCLIRFSAVAKQYQALPARLTAENADPSPLPPPDPQISLDLDGLHLPPSSAAKEDGITVTASIPLSNARPVEGISPDSHKIEHTTNSIKNDCTHGSSPITSFIKIGTAAELCREDQYRLQLNTNEWEPYNGQNSWHHTMAGATSRDEQSTESFKENWITAPSDLQQQDSTSTPINRRDFGRFENLRKDNEATADTVLGKAPQPATKTFPSNCDAVDAGYSGTTADAPGNVSNQSKSTYLSGLLQSFDEHVPSEHISSDDLDQPLPDHSLFAYEDTSLHSAPSRQGLNGCQTSAPIMAISFDATAQSEPQRPELPAIIQVEDNWDDTDSAYNDETQSYTTSLKSSVTNFEYENGRRYHAADGHSWHFLPNDDAEMDRLDLFHHIMHLRCDERLHLAPINPYSQRILDLGTGTGIWAVMMGELYESASVLGNDLSPIQPTLVPPNVSFEVDDMEKEWCYNSSFDYIHCRYLAGAIRDWPKLMRQAYEYAHSYSSKMISTLTDIRYTKPGGWVEFKDFTMKFYSTDGSYERSACTSVDEHPTPTPSPDRWTTEIITGIKSLGLEPEPGPKLEAWMRDTGFINVVHHLLPIPVGDWPKDKKLKRIGRADRTQFLDGLDAISLRVFTTTRGWRPEEVQVLLTDVRRTLKDRTIHTQHDL
ncbi:MAG: hypothetical protein Q9165_004293 [Trypethelium subeluteriae]